MAKVNRLKVVLVEKEKTSKWCTNTTQPSIETFLEIARLLEVDIKELLVESEVNRQLTH